MTATLQNGDEIQAKLVAVATLIMRTDPPSLFLAGALAVVQHLALESGRDWPTMVAEIKAAASDEPTQPGIDPAER